MDITLFHQKILSEPLKEKDSFFKRLKTSLGNGWDMLINGILWCIMQWPWYLLVCVIVVGEVLFEKTEEESFVKRLKKHFFKLTR